MRRFWILLTLLFVGIVPIFAQNTDNQGHIRVAHFSSDAPDVDIYVDGDVVISDLAFGDVSEWLAVDTGTYSVAVTPAGSLVNQAVIGPLDISVEAGDWFTVTAIGEVDAGTLTAQILEEDYSLIGDGESRINIFHAVPNVPPINVDANDTNLITLLGYPGSIDGTNDGFTTVDLLANTYSFEITLEDGTSIATVDDIVLGQNRNYFLAVVGTPAEPQTVLVTTDLDTMMSDMGENETRNLGTGDAQIRVGHFSIDAPAVDIFVNGQRSDFTGLTFPTLSDWTTLSAGMVNVAIVPEGLPINQAVLRADVPIATDTWVTLAAIGSLELENLTVQVIEENSSELPFGETRIGVFHAVVDTGLVDVFANDTLLVQGLGYPGVFEGEGDGYASADVLAGDYNIRVVLENGTEVETGELTLGQSRSYFVALVGTEGNPLYIFDRTDLE